MNTILFTIVILLYVNNNNKKNGHQRIDQGDGGQKDRVRW